MYSSTNSDLAKSGCANLTTQLGYSLNMTEPIAELLMPKAPQIQMSGDVILLDIDVVVPGWETYTFTLDAIHPGEKVNIFFLFCC